MCISVFIYSIFYMYRFFRNCLFFFICLINVYLINNLVVVLAFNFFCIMFLLLSDERRHIFNFFSSLPFLISIYGRWYFSRYESLLFFFYFCFVVLFYRFILSSFPLSSLVCWYIYWITFSIFFIRNYREAKR